MTSVFIGIVLLGFRSRVAISLHQALPAVSMT